MNKISLVGKTIYLRTEDAEYFTCELVKNNPTTLEIQYVSSVTLDKNTGKAIPSLKTDIVKKSKILHLSERS